MSDDYVVYYCTSGTFCLSFVCGCQNGVHKFLSTGTWCVLHTWEMSPCIGLCTCILICERGNLCTHVDEIFGVAS